MSESDNRFEADRTQDGTPIVLDLYHGPHRVVVGCSSDEQAERIASFLNDEFGGQR